MSPAVTSGGRLVNGEWRTRCHKVPAYDEGHNYITFHVF
jgi:hypothetical protein